MYFQLLLWVIAFTLPIVYCKVQLKIVIVVNQIHSHSFYSQLIGKFKFQITTDVFVLIM